MKHKRLILGSILSILLLLLMLYYSLDHNNHDPDPQYILDHYEKYLTTKVRLDGVIKTIDKINHTLLIKVTQSPAGLILVSTKEPLTTTQLGDLVEVYGSFINRTQMTAEKLLITEQWKNDLIYLRSLPAIPFALYLFFRNWRFNQDTHRFERRKKHA